MGDLPANTPDNYIQQEQLIPNTQIEHRLDEYPQMSKKVGDVVIEVKNDVVKIVKKAEISGDTKKETSELSEELTLEQKIKKIDEIYRLENLDKILYKYEGKRMIELYLNDFGGKFDEQNNIMIGEKIIEKGTKEYNHIISKVFESLKEFAKDLIKYNAKEK